MDGFFQRYPTESTAFSVVLRTDVENATIRQEIEKGAAKDTSTWGSINVLMYRSIGRLWHWLGKDHE